MAQSALFSKYLDTCFNKLQQSLEGYMDTGDRALLFRFRVSIKKIRTCLKCIEEYHEEKEFKHTRKELRKMFRSGGALRELLIYEDWFTRNHLLRLSKTIRLDESIKRREATFKKEKDKMATIVTENKKLLLSYADKLSQDQVYRFYIVLLQEHLSLLLGKNGKKGWHKMRKEFKRILYARHWQDENGLRVLSKRQAVFLDQFQHLIGYWHDNEEMIAWLKERQANHDEQEMAGKIDNSRPAFRRAFALLKRDEARFYQKVINKRKHCRQRMLPLCRRLQLVTLVLS